MGEEHQIVRLVYEAKKSPEAADSLIGQYMNFIQAETVRFTQGVPSQVREDQLSVAMFASVSYTHLARRSRTTAIQASFWAVLSRTGTR